MQMRRSAPGPMMEVMRKRSIESVYATDHPRLWRALHAYSGDRDIASDAAAEAFAQALRRGSEIRDPAAWIWRAAFRIASGLLKDRRTTVTVSQLGEIGEAEEPVVHLLESLGALSEQQRAIVSLRYVGELDIAKIAGALDTSPNTVRVQLHRAHKTLRTTFGDTDGA